MADRCRWVNDKVIGIWHLPGCWGAIQGGPDACICEGVDEDDDIGVRLACIEDRLTALEAEIKARENPDG